MSSSHAPVAPTPSPGPSQPPQTDPSSQAATPTILIAPTLPSAHAETPRQTYLPQLVLLGATILGGILASAMPNDGDNTLPRLIFSIPGGLLTLVSVYSFVVQWRALRASRPVLLRLEVILLAAAAVLPAVGLIAGDLSGATAFNNAPQLTPIAVGYTALVCGLFILAFIASANAIYIVTRFHMAVKILGILGYGVAWIITAIAAYFAYSIQYSSHDPNFE